MKTKKRKIDPLPETFDTIEECAEFWDNHSTMDYPEAFSEPIEVETELKSRHFEIEIDKDVELFLTKKAEKLGTTAEKLANDLLRQNIS